MGFRKVIIKNGKEKVMKEGRARKLNQGKRRIFEYPFFFSKKNNALGSIYLCSAFLALFENNVIGYVLCSNPD
jgi:hypothetical protein